MCLLYLGITPAQRAELPATVGTFLMPYFMAKNRIDGERG